MTGYLLNGRGVATPFREDSDRIPITAGVEIHMRHPFFTSFATMAIHCLNLVSRLWLLMIVAAVFPRGILSQSVSMPTIGSYLMTNSTSFSTLITAFERINLFTQLSTTNIAITLFAPTDESFKALESPFNMYLDQDPWIYHLYALLSFHTTGDVLSIAKIFDGTRSNLTTLASGLDMPINQRNKTIDNGANIVTSDVIVTNGIVQVTDRVLIPPTMNTSLEDLIVNGILADNEREFGVANFSDMVKFGNVEGLFYGVDPGGFTVIVPVDSAFANDKSGLVKQIFTPGNENITMVIVEYHTAPYNLFVERVTSMNPPQLPVQMSNGITAWLSLKDNQLQINEARFVVSNDLRSNGVAHFIDQYLVPPDLHDLMDITTKVTTFSFKAFLQALANRAISLTGGGNYLTVFAPVTSAFEDQRDLVTRWGQIGWEVHFNTLLKNHLAEVWLDSQGFIDARLSKVAMVGGFNVIVNASSSDGVITVNGDAEIIVSDLFAIDGVTHGIDKLLIPSPLTKSIYQQLSESPDFSVLVQMIDAAGLKEDVDSTPSDNMPWTFLAPSNNVLKGINISDTNATRQSLESHMFPANYFFPNILALTNSTTTVTTQWTARNGAKWTVTVVQEGGGSIYVGSGKLGEAPFKDQLASNGVIQSIDHWFVDATKDTLPPFPVSNSTIAASTLAPAQFSVPSSITTDSTTAPTQIFATPTLVSTAMPTSASSTKRNPHDRTKSTLAPATPDASKASHSTSTLGAASQFFTVTAPAQTASRSATTKRSNHQDMLILLFGLIGLALVAAVALGVMAAVLFRPSAGKESPVHHHHHHHHHHHKEKVGSMV